MKKFFLILFASLLFVVCETDAQEGNVAIVNLDAVAKELGILDYIANTLKSQEDRVNGDLKSLQEQLQGELETVIKDLGEKPSNEDVLKAKRQNRELELQFQNKRVEAAQNLQKQKSQMISSFRNQLKPHALAVAKKRNFSVVLNTVMPPVFAFDSSADITQDLIVLAREKGLAKN